jgi:hypothetical protein
MRGASLAELVVALGLTLVLSGLAAVALVESAAAFAWQPASGDLDARARSLARALASDLSGAGAGPAARFETTPPGSRPTDRLTAWMPPVLPRIVGLDGADPDAVAAGDRLSVVTIRAGAPQATIRRAPPRWHWLPGPTCPALVDGCRVDEGLPLLVLAPAIGFRLAEAAAVDADGLDLAGIDDVASGTDALVAAAGVVSYRFDRARGEILRARAGGRAMPMLGDIVAFTVEYWGDAAPPAPFWPAAGETCLTFADGTARLPRLAPAGAPAVRLDLGQLGDGPWCGEAPFRFDADLLRVQRVRLRIRVQAEAAALRGGDRRRFAQPGQATSGAREVADLDLAIDVAPPALRGPS